VSNSCEEKTWTGEEWSVIAPGVLAAATAARMAFDKTVLGAPSSPKKIESDPLKDAVDFADGVISAWSGTSLKKKTGGRETVGGLGGKAGYNEFQNGEGGLLYDTVFAANSHLPSLERQAMATEAKQARWTELKKLKGSPSKRRIHVIDAVVMKPLHPLLWKVVMAAKDDKPTLQIVDEDEEDEKGVEK
jgi:hypothetical protein